MKMRFVSLLLMKRLDSWSWHSEGVFILLILFLCKVIVKAHAKSRTLIRYYHRRAKQGKANQDTDSWTLRFLWLSSYSNLNAGFSIYDITQKNLRPQFWTDYWPKIWRKKITKVFGLFQINETHIFLATWLVSLYITISLFSDVLFLCCLLTDWTSSHYGTM